MSWTTAKKEAFAKSDEPFDVRVLILKDDGITWLDMTERIPASGTGEDRLVKLGKVVHSAELKTGTFYTESRTIAFNNSDRYFSGTPPSGITSWLRHRIKFTLNGEAIGTFLIEDGPTLSTSDQTAVFKLVGLQKKLREARADGVKDGQSWYANRPIGYLVEKLYEHEFPDGDYESGSPPAGIQIPLQDTTEILPSHYGRPPEWDGTNWRKDGLICRAVIWANSKLYLGCDNELWEWDPDTEIYTKRGDTATPAVDWTIVKMWWDSNRSKIYMVVLYSDIALPGVCTMRLYDCAAAGSPSLVKAFTGVFSGRHQFRRGRGPVDFPLIPSTGYVVGNPAGATSEGAGENMCLPFPQEIIAETTDDTEVSYDSSTADGLFDRVAGTNSGVTPHEATGGYGAAQNMDRLCDTLFNMGTRYCIDYDENDGVLLFCTKVGAAGNWQVKTYDVDTDVTTTEDSSATIQPLDLVLARKSGTTYIIRWGIYFDESDDADAIAYMHRGTVGAASLAEIWDASDVAAENYYAPLQVIYSPGTDLFHGCYIKRDHLLANKYHVFVMNWDASSKTWDLEYGSHMPLSGFVVEGGFVYYIDQGTGQLYRYTDASSAQVLTLQASGLPATEYEPCLLAGLACKTGTPPTFYGISSPVPLPELWPSTPSGNYFLFQFKNELTDRVDLADFTDLSVHDAIALLSQVVDYIWGFNEDGEFFFKVRPSGTPSEVLQEWSDCGEGEYKIGSIVRTPGTKDIFNYVELYPYGVIAKDPEGSVELTGDSYFKSRVHVQQRDKAKKVVYLYCTSSGQVVSGNVNHLRFRWVVHDALFETALSADASTADTYIDVYNVEDVAAGDIVQVQNSADKTVSSVTAATNRINLTTTVGADYDKGAVVKIRKLHHNRPSDHPDGVTAINGASGTGDTLTVDSTEHTPVGSVIAMHSSVGTEECKVLTVNSATELELVRGYGGTTALNHPDDTPVLAYFSPDIQDHFFEVGNTRIDVKVVDDADAHIKQKTFQVGDRLVIKGQGSVLEKIEFAKQMAVDKDSVEAHGELRFPNVDNRFFGYAYAAEAVKRFLAEYADSKFGFIVNGPLLPWVTLAALVYVESKELLLESSSYREASVTKKAEFDLTTKSAKWEFRALNTNSF